MICLRLFIILGLVTEYETESEDEPVSDPEPLPEKDEVAVKKGEDAETYYVMKEELGR